MSESDLREGRPDTDDYDLLTYGEAAARLSELLATERDALEVLRQQADPDPAAVEGLRRRIALLEYHGARYRRQSLTAEAFIERFGFSPRSDGGGSR